jgi:PAS domain-containing protein
MESRARVSHPETEEKIKSTEFKPYLLLLLMAVCTLVYYFGELIDWAAWDSIRANFFYGIHDVHRLLFLAPIVYTGYTAGSKGAIIITLISFVIFLPRAFFISPYPDPLLRMVIFTVFAGVIGVLVGNIRRQTAKYHQLEIAEAREKSRLKEIIDGLADGIVITDRDYKIRFMNASMVRDYGEGSGITCYKHLRNSDEPCRKACKIEDVITGGDIQRWECEFPDGKIYEITAAPYKDSDGTECQISVFRDTGRRKTV